MSKKIKPRRHGRAPRKQLDDAGVLKRQTEAILNFDRAFRQDLPRHEPSGQNAVSAGNYVQVEGDKYDGQDYPIADGKYRVEGSDWIHTFEGGGYVESEKAEAPHYGGKDVIRVVAP